MKRRELIRMLEKMVGIWSEMVQNHDIYTNGKNTEPIPRHPEIKEVLAKAIIKRNGLK